VGTQSDEKHGQKEGGKGDRDQNHQHQMLIACQSKSRAFVVRSIFEKKSLCDRY
jgi:hypothetical protein